MKVQKACEIVEDPYYTAIKYADGRAECYRLIPIDDFQVSTYAGNIYYGTYSTYDYPGGYFPNGLFVDVPTVNATYMASDSFMAFIYGIDRVTASRAGTIYLARGQTGTLNGYISYHALGRWK